MNGLPYKNDMRPKGLVNYGCPAYVLLTEIMGVLLTVNYGCPAYVLLTC